MIGSGQGRSTYTRIASREAVTEKIAILTLEVVAKSRSDSVNPAFNHVLVKRPRSMPETQMSKTIASVA
ncbi:hypothetical protein AGABI2DRAFT_187709 [Agaricus bisporus var. bisporus H97]|uniref:hypothetical protein n=1 Tax=Agaricus bisporus var. bisporus (strain H97 / ATCC MYA-4626 / FGSC 10389) TaxID=936046 RepID=UPI00029F77D1|nr:hypothetical protein AGABI2DRAFT_187709 [Agaricus bisporus var. bisporus H97]EKV44025.1 hypothetical protein AGABI2DRAFT_187709 [Agaricus bisporus var. bisporus H97]